MKKVEFTWNGIEDSTGYLWSFAKSLATAVKGSPYSELYEDIIATSGFAFRMWVAEDLCPSALSIWSFAKQKEWVENGGLICGYVERLWDQEDKEQECLDQAVELVKESIDAGIVAVSWDISGCEWGLVTGYEEESRTFATAKMDGSEETIPYEKLGKLELPILSVLTIRGRQERTQEEITKGMLALAVSHLQGEEWCDNKQGLEVYPALIDCINNQLNEERTWNLEYYLGTYGALKKYALNYFEKYDLKELAESYRIVYKMWMQAFETGKSKNVLDGEVKKELVEYLQRAYEAELQAFEQMKQILGA